MFLCYLGAYSKPNYLLSQWLIILRKFIYVIQKLKNIYIYYIFKITNFKYLKN